jgi:hypothetical protein
MLERNPLRGEEPFNRRLSGAAAAGSMIVASLGGVSC